MKADICILTACKDMLIEKCLDSLVKHVPKSSIGKVVVCCTSDEAVKKFMPVLKKHMTEMSLNIMTTQMEYNFACCNNAIARLCDAECILFLNDDVELVEDSVTPCLRALEDGRIGTVGTMLVYPSGTIQHAGVFCAWQTSEEKKKVFRGVGHYGIMQRQPFPDMWTFGNTGAFLVVRRSDFEAVGGFNESYKHCFEDVELNAKIAMLHEGANLTLNTHRAIHRESSTRNQASCREDLQMLADFCTENSGRLDMKIIGVEYQHP